MVRVDHIVGLSCKVVCSAFKDLISWRTKTQAKGDSRCLLEACTSCLSELRPSGTSINRKTPAARPYCVLLASEYIYPGPAHACEARWLGLVYRLEFEYDTRLRACWNLGEELARAQEDLVKVLVVRLRFSC